MSGSKKKAGDVPAETTTIRALRPLDVDQVRIAEGEVAEIRAELVATLVEIGAAEVVTPVPKAEG